MNKNINLNILGGQSDVQLSIKTGDQAQGVQLTEAVRQFVELATVLANGVGPEDRAKIVTSGQEMTRAAAANDRPAVGQAAKVVGDVAKSASGNIVAKAVLAGYDALIEAL